MKMNFIIRPLFSLVFALLMISCIDDKGNYDYRDTNIVTFEGLQSEYTINYGEAATIKPEMKQTIPVDESKFSYVWLRVGTDKTGVPVDTVHKGKYLENQSFTLLPRSTPYKMVYVAINNETGVEHASDYFKVRIVGDIATGFLMLHEVNGETVLRFYNYKDKYLQPRTVDLSDLGDDIGKPISISTYTDQNSPYLGSSAADGQYSLSLLTEGGLYRLRYNDFHYQANYNIRYSLMGTIPDDFRIKNLWPTQAKATSMAVMQDQNDNYMPYVTAGMTYLMWAPGVVCNKYSIGGVITEPFRAKLLLNAGTNYYFDYDSKSFALRTADGSYCTNYAETAGDFKFNNVDYEPLFLGFKSYDTPTNGGAYALVKKNNGDYQLLSWTHSGAAKRFVRNVNNWPDIANIKHFAMVYTRLSAMNTEFGSLIYYATDKKIYCYHMGYEDIREVYSAPAGNVIGLIKIDATPNGAFETKMLVVTNSESGAETSTFEIFSMESRYGTLTIMNSGHDQNPQTYRWTALPKIVSIDWKNK